MKAKTEQRKIVMIRHGVTASNKEHRYLGRADEPLSPEGKETLRENQKQGKYPEIDVLFASPMMRCTETAAILYPHMEVHKIEEWREMDFGDFEGKNYSELKDDARYQAWIDSNGTLAFPNGESREEFVARAVRGYRRMLSELAEQGRESDMTIGAIVHGGIIMALSSTLCGGDYFDYQIANGEIFEFALTEERKRI